MEGDGSSEGELWKLGTPKCCLKVSAKNIYTDRYLVSPSSAEEKKEEKKEESEESDDDMGFGLFD